MARDSLGQRYCMDRGCQHDHEQCPDWRIDKAEAEVDRLRELVKSQDEHIITLQRMNDRLSEIRALEEE